ncbi:NUDIX domain-containing protein [Aestuariibius sp. 2305UL40-4]|uniref:NUDIX domain-containing protein n=1 Tax=Aestuariibius violaceus TaxID=3234132 RepID=UPI00345E23D6
MSYLGTPWAENLPRMRGMIEARAWSRHLARTRDLSTANPTREVQSEGHTRKHAGFFRFDEYRLRHGRFDGSMSGLLTREVFVGSDAALVLPYDPVRDEVVLIEQFRMGPFARSDPAPWVYEPIAGLVDPGEDPSETALREALEEAGLTIDRLEPIAATYASPGAATDFFHCYLGFCSLDTAESWLGGEKDEGEDIRSHRLSFADAIALVDTGRINVAPLAMMLHWLARNRERLRTA